MNGNQEKFKSINIRFSFSFFVLALILGVTFFLLLTGEFRYYRSQVSVLFIPKSEKAAFHTPYILANLVKIPRTLAFYDRLLKDNPELTDQFSGRSKDERKKLWNKTLGIKQENKSTFINIEIMEKDRTQSVQLAEQATRTLIDTASRYYNIKTDIDLRIVEGPITTPILKYWYWLILLSAALGLLSSFLLNVIFSAFINLARVKKDIFKLPRFERKEENKIAAMEEELVIPGFPAGKEESTARKSKAPENLPVADEIISPPQEELYDIPPALNGEAAEILEEEPKEITEPTEEELKKRLNQLLRGEL
ncbi:MAG: hypothetical protein NT136_02790 [Candidatus Moranbacteria bacterium]|nr:hypothetical protein [Candidatus Moranbacteria bacterium]